MLYFTRFKLDAGPVSIHKRIYILCIDSFGTIMLLHALQAVSASSLLYAQGSHW